MTDTGPLKVPDPWGHIRAHAAEGGLYATCLAELCDRVNEQDKSTAGCIVDLRRSVQLLVDALAKASERLAALEARPEVQVLPSTPRDCGPTLLAPAMLWPSIEPDAPSELKQPLLNEVAELIDPSDPVAALGTAGLVIRACASYLAEDDWDGAAAVLKRVADRG